MIPLPVPRTVPGFLANLLAALALTGVTLSYVAWRFGESGGGDGPPPRDWPVRVWGVVAIGLGPMLAVPCWFNAGRFLWGRLKERVGEPPPEGEGCGAARERPLRDLAVAAVCLAAVGCLAFSLATRPTRTMGEALAYVGLALLSLPLAFGMIPAVRHDAWRWARWLLLRR